MVEWNVSSNKRNINLNSQLADLLEYNNYVHMTVLLGYTKEL